MRLKITPQEHTKVNKKVNQDKSYYSKRVRQFKTTDKNLQTY